MLRRACRRALLFALLVSWAAVPACGGGGDDGGGGGGLTSLLSGPFYVFALEGQEVPGTRTVRCTYGAVTLDGAEGLTGAVRYNENGTISPSPEPVSEDYWVATDGTFSLEGDTGAFVLGGVSRDGTFGILGSRQAGDNPQIIAIAKRGSGFSTASLSGDFHVAAFELTDKSVNRGLFGTFQASGGNATLTYSTVNEDGTPDAGFMDTVLYNVNADGSFNWAGTTTENFQGQLLGGGVLGIAHAQTGGPATLAVIRHASSATEGTFNGEYFWIGFRHNSGGLGYVSETGRLYPNGSGGGSWSATMNNAGTVVGFGGLLDQYTVQPNGELNVQFDTGIEAEGAVSEDGRFAILGGAASGPPYFALLIRNDFTGP